MKIAAIQIQSTLDFNENLKKIRQMMKNAKEQKAQAVFLPEVFYSITDGLSVTPYLISEGKEHYKNIKNLSTEFGMYVLGGSAATELDGKVVNRSYNFSPDGKDLGFYDKMNLFSCDLSNDPTKLILDENRLYTAGKTPKIIDVGEFKMGLSVCFDLRFPELYRHYSSQGANLLTISSAFTKPTGKAHWHTLVRARAIENQCYVVATGQCGIHNERVSTFGHSLIVDPWGEILQDAGENENIIYADITLDRVREIRSRLNVIRDPRYM